MSVATENPQYSPVDFTVEHGPYGESEPLGQEVGLTVHRTALPNQFVFTERISEPPIIAYTREKKREIEAKAPGYLRGYTHFRHNGADIYHGVTRSLGAGQLTMTRDGRLVLIGKSPDYDANKIEGFDLIAGASQQTGDINFHNTAAREGSAEELVEIRNGKIIVPEGNKKHAVIKSRENIEQFLNKYTGVLPEPFDSTFNRVLDSKTDELFHEDPYQTDQRMARILSNVPQGSVSIVRNGETIHTSRGFTVIHEKGGDILFPRVPDTQFIIDLEIVTNPDGSTMVLNRPFILATPEQYISLCRGEKAEVELTRLGQHWHESIQVDPKPLAREFGRYLASPSY